MRERASIFTYIKYILICVLLILFMVPFYLMVINSFKTTQQFVNDPFSLPVLEKLSFVNYISAYEKMNFNKAILNSAIITSISVSLILLTSPWLHIFL